MANPNAYSSSRSNATRGGSTSGPKSRGGRQRQERQQQQQQNNNQNQGQGDGRAANRARAAANLAAAKQQQIGTQQLKKRKEERRIGSLK